LKRSRRLGRTNFSRAKRSRRSENEFQVVDSFPSFAGNKFQAVFVVPTFAENEFQAVASLPPFAGKPPAFFPTDRLDKVRGNTVVYWHD
ncbi:MAG: hypothetical protein K2K67_09810, partial [Treponemataceae bacterium]|nr:hypothetical protein [Treponemataceae bacterium]